MATKHRFWIRSGWVVFALLLMPGCSDEGFISPDGAVPRDASGEMKPAPDQGGKDQAFLDQLLPDQAAPDQTAPDSMAPDQLFGDQLIPDQLIPDLFVASDGAASTAATFTTGSNTVTRGSATGGTAYYETCPAGQALIGFYGQIRSGAQYHGKIGAKCGLVSMLAGAGGAKGVVVSAGKTYSLHGKYGSSTTWNRDCAANQVIVGFRGRAGGLVDQLIFRCAPLSITGSSGAYTVTVGTTTDLAAIGGSGGNLFSSTDCPTGQVANTSRIRAGDGLDGFGLGCATPKF